LSNRECEKVTSYDRRGGRYLGDWHQKDETGTTEGVRVKEEILNHERVSATCREGKILKKYE